MYWQNALLFGFTSFAKCNSSWAIAFLKPSLHDQTAAPDSSWVTCPCFHLLYTSLLCLSSVRSSLLIHEGLLLPLLDFLLVRMELSWAWRRFLPIKQLSRTPLLSRAVCDGILPSRSLKKLTSALLKSRVVLFALLPSLSSLSSTSSRSLQPRLPLTCTPPTSSPSFVRRSPSRAPFLAGCSVTCV